MDPARAATLMRSVVTRCESREAWLGLATACQLSGDRDGAVRALHEMLRRLAVDTSVSAFADRLARDEGLVWCGLDLGGRVVASMDGPLRYVLDGAEIRPRSGALPAGAATGRRLAVMHGGNRHCVGSPIDLAAHRRIRGFVEWADDGRVVGWIHQPSRPDIAPAVTLIDSVNTHHRLTPHTRSAHAGGALVAAWDIAVSAAQRAHLKPPFRVVDPNGADLPGSPVDPDIRSRSAVTTHPVSRPRGDTPIVSRPRPPAIVIPISHVDRAVAACLRTVCRNTQADTPILLIDDAADDRDAVRALASADVTRRARVIRHARHRGLAASVNSGLRAAGRRDVILLGSETLVAPGWVERLRNAAYASHDAGTASPFASHGAILGYPAPDHSLPDPTVQATERLAVHASRANGDAIVDLPATDGLCMYVRRACLDDIGPFRTEHVAEGYGADVDFCIRARHRGWRHVAATGLYVTHRGSGGFGTSHNPPQHDRRALERLHPEWVALADAFRTEDPLRGARRRIDLRRWTAMGRHRKAAVALVTHDDGGGVERVVMERCAALSAEGRRPIVLRPADASGIRLEDGPARSFPNLGFVMPDELPSLLDLLRASGVAAVEFHHMLGHHPSVLTIPAALGVPYDVRLHDYAWLCPRVTLVAKGRYCGEPDVSICECCVADNGRMVDEDISVRALRGRSSRLLAGARRVTAPSADAASRLRRHFPGVPVAIAGHEDDTAWPRPVPRAGGAPLVVGVTGAIGIDKGFDVLLACAQDAAARDLPLAFVLIGHSIDDRRLLATGRCHVTGRYAPGEAAALLAAEHVALGFIPSIWPETWCFALSDIWEAGLPAVSFDIGAPAERIRRTGSGFVLPLGLTPAAVNDALLAGPRRIGQKDLSKQASRTPPATHSADLSHPSPVPKSETSRHV